MANLSFSPDHQWRRLLARILTEGTTIAPRSLPTRELLGSTTTVLLAHPVLEVPGRDLGYRFLCAEAAWLLDGDNRVATIAPYSKEIARFSDDGLTFAGAYGPPLRDQLPWVATQLLTDPATRQAVAVIWRPRPGPSKDVPCTVALQWLLRPSASGTDQLHCVATMRSSDAWLGWPYDVFNLSVLSAYLGAVLLHRGYPAPLALGRLHLTAGSQHLYAPQWDRAQRCLAEPERPATLAAPLDSTAWAADPDALARDLWATARSDGTGSVCSPFLVELTRFVIARHNQRLVQRQEA